jgi:hypothetical protein
MTWVIPHPDAAGTLYHASDDYRWFRLIVGFERGICTGIDNGQTHCGIARLTATGDGQIVQVRADRGIGSTDETTLQTVAGSFGTNKITTSLDTIAASVLYRGVRQSDAIYRYTSLFIDLRTLWRTGQALSKLTITGDALIQADFGGGSSCDGCTDIFTAWQTDWISADLGTVTAIDDTVPELDTTVLLTATAPGHVSATIPLTILDNDRPEITLAANRTTIPEGSPPGELVVTISRQPVTTTPFTVAALSVTSTMM